MAAAWMSVALAVSDAARRHNRGGRCGRRCGGGGRTRCDRGGGARVRRRGGAVRGSACRSRSRGRARHAAATAGRERSARERGHDEELQSRRRDHAVAVSRTGRTGRRSGLSARKCGRASQWLARFRPVMDRRFTTTSQGCVSCLGRLDTPDHRDWPAAEAAALPDSALEALRSSGRSAGRSA